MIQLHAVGLSGDGKQLLLAAHPEAEAAGYAVEIDADLLKKLDSEKSGEAKTDDKDRPEQPPEPERKLPEGPLEVDSPDEALKTAHELWLVRGENDISDEALHDAVLANLNRWNVRIPQEILDEGWWVTKLGDTAWQISFRFLTRGRIHEAEWVLDTEAARLVPENKLADHLGFWKKRQRSRARRRRGGRGRGRSRSKKK